MYEIEPLDVLVLAILVVALSRGAFIGMIREIFSIAALVAACIALRLSNSDASAWLTEVSGNQIGSGVSPWITGTLIFVATIAITSFVGRQMQRGAQAAGLGWADRIGGGILGAAEGGLFATVIVSGMILAMGRNHPTIYGTRTLAAVEIVQAYVIDNLDQLPAVASPPASRPNSEQSP